MTKSSKYKTFDFTLVGKLSKIKLKSGKIKYLKLIVDDRKLWIKISKQVRNKLDRQFCSGDILEIAGEQKQRIKTGKSKFEAHSVKLIAQPATSKIAHIKQKQVSLAPIFSRQKKSPAKVLVCQKSNCWKRGGKEICQQLETAFGDRGLDNLIQIKKTGCLKKCKKAPNLVMMPDKASYSQVKAQEIPNLIEKHLIV